MYNATAYNHAYVDSGVFCIHASAHPTEVSLIPTMVQLETYTYCATKIYHRRNINSINCNQLHVESNDCDTFTCFM